MERQVSTMRTCAALRLGRAPRLPISSVQYGQSGVRRWSRSSFGFVVALVAVIGFSLPTPGLAGKEDPSPTVTILVYNHMQVSTEILAGAEREAGRILAEAGLQPVWLDCLDRDSAADLQELCHKGREPFDLVLRVLPGHIQGRLQDTLFGFAFPPALASVYYEYAGRLASSDREISIMLGCAIAHEVGHLLLGPNSHSAGGIMQGEWGAKQIQLALMGRLLFASQQEKLIRAEARRRMNLQTGTPKEQRLATVDPRAEPKGIPQSERLHSDNSKPTFYSPVERILEDHPGHSLNVWGKLDLHFWQDLRKAGVLFFESDQSQRMRATHLRQTRKATRTATPELHQRRGAPKICGVSVFCHSPSFWSDAAQPKDSPVRAA